MNTEKTRAVIMAGGLGERLRPITDRTPKPIVPIGDGKAIFGAIRMLSEIGIKTAWVTVRYKYEEIIKELGDSVFGVKLFYVIENENLGTAGGVRKAVDEMKKTGKFIETIVLSGDAVSDYDLSFALNMHRSRGAAATMLLTRSEEPWRYGVVKLDGTEDSGRIEGFAEKPKDAVAGAMVNTGMYILSDRAVGMIPSRGEYDFGRELFPMMLRRGEKLYGIEGKGYWCDIGTPESYVKCCHDAVLGRIGGFGGSIDLSGAVISQNARVGEGSRLTGSVLHEGVSVGEDVRANDAVFCRGVSVGCRVTIGEGAVIGADTYIGDGVRIPDGAKIAPNSKVESGAEIFAENL